VSSDKVDRKTVLKCFIIQPFGIKEIPGTDRIYDYDEVYNALDKLKNIDQNFIVEISRADTEQYDNAHVAENIHNHIKSADFCIADITGKNPNVMYEIGVARGKNVEVIVICEENETMPTDLNGIVYVKYNQDNISGLASRVKQHFKRVLNSARDKYDMLPTVQYLASRNDEFIREKIRNSRQRIDILQTNLSILQRDFVDDISLALDTYKDLKVRILTLDPQSVFVNYRANQLPDTNVKIFRDDLSNALAATYTKLKKHGNRVSIKIYDDFPSQIAFFFDRETLACVVSAMGRSRNNCAFLVPTDMPNAQESFGQHFSHLWSNKNSHTYGQYGID
jgi:hypothetical protein